MLTKTSNILNKVGSCQRSIVLRPFISKDFMTGVAAIPGNHIPVEVVNQIADEISKVCKIVTCVAQTVSPFYREFDYRGFVKPY